MALETGQRAWPRGLVDYVIDGVRSFSHVTAPVWSAIARAIQVCGGAWVARFVGASLSRRIFISNITGLAVLIFGILLLSKHNAWLIEAKRDSLVAQGEIIAAAIASNPVERNNEVVLDPDKLPDIDGGKIPFRTDGFTPIDQSIKPEVVTPVLRRLMRSKNVRARIYGRDASLIVDSAQLLQKGQVARKEPVQADKPKARNWWTRTTEMLTGTDLSVYQEIGSASGATYPEFRNALKNGVAASMVLLTPDRQQIVAVAAPIMRQNVVFGVLLLSTRPGEIDNILFAERMAILTIGILALLATILASTLLARTVAGPMKRLSAAAEHVSHNITARQDIPEFPGRTDEIGQMAQAFRSMTAALYRRIEASEKFAADVAHELKNPLAAARSTAESLTYARTDEQRNQQVAQIQLEIKRLNRLITDVSNASRLDAELALQQTQPIDLKALTSGIVMTFGDLLSDKKKTISIDIAAGCDAASLVIEGHEGRISQVMTNLIDNALSFSPEDGAVKVVLGRNGPDVEIAVEDAGPGIEDSKLETVFDRFYTYRPTASSSRGTNSGLGLSISREIVRAHGGQVWAENRVADDGTRCGARFVVRLPSSQSRASTQRSSAWTRRVPA